MKLILTPLAKLSSPARASKRFSSSLKLLGWPNSPFTAKVHGYLRFKQIPFDDVTVSAVGMHMKIYRKTGRYMMPVVYHPMLGILQDSAEIIDRMETFHRDHPVVPRTPRQRFLSTLLECFADEWLISAAMHTRWNSTEYNREYISEEFGRLACPLMPAFLQRHVGTRIGRTMAAYLPILGVTENTSAGFDAFLHHVLSTLDAHLSRSRYLLGALPSTADFALMGPLYAMVWRDQHSGWRQVVEQHQHVYSWLLRTHSPEPSELATSSESSWLSNDEIPDTLIPLLKPIVDDFLPFARDTVEAVNHYCSTNSSASRVPRALGWTDFTMCGSQGKKKTISFLQWKLQRVNSVLEECTEPERTSLIGWLKEVHLYDHLMTIKIECPMARQNYKEVLTDNQT